jgi:hypothetical protein
MENQIVRLTEYATLTFKIKMHVLYLIARYYAYKIPKIISVNI